MDFGGYNFAYLFKELLILKEITASVESILRNLREKILLRSVYTLTFGRKQDLFNVLG
jgi:hypothetical protein